MPRQPLDILRTVFGFQEFRGHQAEIIEHVVAGGDALVYPDCFPRTLERLRAAGIAVTTVDVSELQKAEGAMTCCSLVFRTAGAP